MTPAAAEYSVSRNYLDWILALPWSAQTRDRIDIKRATKILDEDHYDLEKIKERILEYLAVIKLRKGLKGPILCFAGPPGVGKTSLGKSIARALGRKFIRMSLGGMRDEAEIRGHRRTYVGAMPGRIISSLKSCGSNNPVIMLDEIDKLGSDFRGDPASALLEVLDPEQNNTFVDHYLDLEFDLSKVMFITTANMLETIPGPLRDRMETLTLSGYTFREKIEIAKRYLIKRAYEDTGVSDKHIAFADDALEEIVENYTREAGLRNLEREIGNLCRKAARKIAAGEWKSRQTLRRADISEYLGPARYFSETAERAMAPGVSIGLAWTPVGGAILFIEASESLGSGKLSLTGQLGDVMRESAQAAHSYLRAHARDLGISQTMFSKRDIHVHIPAGATPKDGPSAGVAILTALASLLTGRPIREKTAMTGEITLKGVVLPVGGIKEKVLAAHRAGIRRIYLPKQNEKDMLDTPAEAREQIEFVLVDRIDEILDSVFQPAAKPRAAARTAAAKTAARSAKPSKASNAAARAFSKGADSA
ncbi:MAG: Lon protease 2 [candidate division BRC1 bacterium ADurb.BinA364]|nr:MAG: Lon protease 2 [candidate division BRC1 bacterium ADurb.BinA364]